MLVIALSSVMGNLYRGLVTDPHSSCKEERKGVRRQEKLSASMDRLSSFLKWAEVIR